MFYLQMKIFDTKFKIYKYQQKIIHVLNRNIVYMYLNPCAATFLLENNIHVYSRWANFMKIRKFDFELIKT